MPMRPRPVSQLHQTGSTVPVISPVPCLFFIIVFVKVKSLGADAELQIITSLDNLREYCDIVFTGGSPASFDTEVKKLQMIVTQRKLLRG
jgi:hypothetical protein